MYNMPASGVAHLAHAAASWEFDMKVVVLASALAVKSNRHILLEGSSSGLALGVKCDRNILLESSSGLALGVKCDRNILLESSPGLALAVKSDGHNGE